MFPRTCRTACSCIGGSFLGCGVSAGLLYYSGRGCLVCVYVYVRVYCLFCLVGTACGKVPAIPHLYLLHFCTWYDFFAINNPILCVCVCLFLYFPGPVVIGTGSTRGGGSSEH